MKRMIYIGFGSTAAIDCGIAIIMSMVLFKNSSGTSNKCVVPHIDSDCYLSSCSGVMELWHISSFFLLGRESLLRTSLILLLLSDSNMFEYSLAALATVGLVRLRKGLYKAHERLTPVIQYTANRSSVLYLGIEFSVSRRQFPVTSRIYIPYLYHLQCMQTRFWPCT